MENATDQQIFQIVFYEDCCLEEKYAACRELQKRKKPKEKRYYYVTPADYEIAKMNGISRKRVNERVRGYGWDVERAITTPPRKMSSMPKWLKALCKENGVSSECFWRRVREHGWTQEEAATTPPLSPEEVGERTGKRRRKYTDEQRRIMKENGVTVDRVSWRIGAGWPLEEAISTPPIQSHELHEWKLKKGRNMGFDNDHIFNRGKAQ